MVWGMPILRATLNIFAKCSLDFVYSKGYHPSANFILMVVTRAISNSSKNHAFLMCRIWKMGRNLFSSLDIRDNLKVAFLGKILSNMSWHLPQKRIAPLLYLVINMTDWLSRVFVEIAVSLSNSSRERSINSTERQAQGASATCNKNFTGRSQLNTVGQCQIYWEAGPQTSAQVSCTNSDPTVIQLHRLYNSHLAWADFEIKVKRIAHSTLRFDQWNLLISKM